MRANYAMRHARSMVAPVTATACPSSLDKMASLGVFLVGIHDPYDETLGVIRPVLTTG